MVIKGEIYGVVWWDKMLGRLSLRKPDADAALAAAVQIRASQLVHDVRAVRVTADDKLEYLDQAIDVT